MRDSFIFYRSFWESVMDLSVDENASIEERYKTTKEQLDVFLFLCDYAFNGNEPPRGGIASALFRQMKPQIDANNVRYENGKKGGRPKTKTEPNNNRDITEGKPNNNQDVTKRKPKSNQGETEHEPNVNVNDNDNVNVNEKVNVKDIKPMRTRAQGMTASQMVIDHGFSPSMQAKVLDWIKYKVEKRQGYKETGLKSLLTVVQRQIDLYGEDAVIRCIEDSMAAGWQGIAWQRIEGKPKSKDRYEEIRSWFSEGTA